MALRDVNFDKKILWFAALLILAALLPVLFVSTAYCRIVAAVVLAFAAGITVALVKKRRTPGIYYRQVLGLMAVIAVLYIVLTYLSGLLFGFYRNFPILSWRTFFYYILPAIVIICATEIVRGVLLASKSTAIPFITYAICIVSDLLLGQGIASIGNIYDFLDVFGLTLFPSITSNLLYNHLSKRYGALPNIVYRLILSVTVSFLPLVPAIPGAINAFVLMVLPFAVWWFIDLLYEKKIRTAVKRTDKWSFVGVCAAFLCMLFLTLTVSGHAKYNLLVIATPSMEGEINVGDAVIYEKYDDQLISEGDVIVFSKDINSLIVHRVVKIEYINGQIRYFTKGDANEDRDSGYITVSEIRGVVLCKVPHIGHPSLWLRGLFS